jgi:hypothetical protein
MFDNVPQIAMRASTSTSIQILYLLILTITSKPLSNLVPRTMLMKPPAMLGNHKRNMKHIDKGNKYLRK